MDGDLMRQQDTGKLFETAEAAGELCTSSEDMHTEEGSTRRARNRVGGDKGLMCSIEAS